MNFKTIVASLFIILSSAPVLACQPDSRCRGHCDRKFTKGDLRAGPDQHQKHKQDLWEMVKAKKGLKGQSSDGARTAAQYEILSKMLASAAMASEQKYSQSYCSSRPVRCSQPVIPALLFTLLFMIRFVNADNSLPICNSCVQLQNEIEAMSPAFEPIRTYVNNHQDVFGPANFPKPIKMQCPTGSSNPLRAIRECDQFYNQGKQFLAAWVQREQEVDRQIDEHNKHADAQSKLDKDEYIRLTANREFAKNKDVAKQLRQKCIKLQNDITALMPQILEQQEKSRKCKGQPIFPEIIKMDCPPIDEEFDPYKYIQAYEWYEKGQKFVEELWQATEKLEHCSNEL